MDAPGNATMTSAGVDEATAQSGADAHMRITIIDTIEAAEPVWRRLEDDGLVTPYQRFDWCRAAIASGVETGELAIALIGGPCEPLALLPLAIQRRFGLRRARLIATAISNADSLVMSHRGNQRLAATRLDALLVEIGRAAGIDALTLHNITPQWQGLLNPLMKLDRQVSPSRSYHRRIGNSDRPFIEHSLNTKLRANLKRGTRRIEEMLGPVRLETVRDASRFEEVHEVFLAQRNARFSEMGVSNVFAEPHMRRFFVEAARIGFTQLKPVFVAHALTAGDEILATSFGAVSGTHYSQYINSTTSGPAGKYSLMGILIGRLMDDLLDCGIETFDMGVGDFAYKMDWTEPQTVYDALLPVTARGEVLLQASTAAIALKRTIKQTPALWSVAQRVRRSLHGLRRR